MAKKNDGADASAQAEGGGEVSENDLTKALDLLEGASQTSDDEKQGLLSKAMDGSITPEENDRLAELLSGVSAATPVVDEVTKSLRPENDERLQKSLDVSEYLGGLHGGLTTALEKVAEHLEKSDNRQHNFNVVLAKSMRAIGEVVQAVDSRLGVIEEQPVGGPKAIQSPAQIPHLQKSFKGQGGQGTEDKLSKSVVLDTLEAMNIDSLEKGRDGQAHCGEDLTKAIAKYEATTHMSRPLYNELKQFRGAAGSN